MVVPETDHIVTTRMGNRLSYVVEMVHSEASVMKFQLAEFAMQMQVRVLACFYRDPKQVGIVVAEYDVNLSLETIREFVNDERRAEVAAADEGVAIGKLA